jgi:hypothetical protein
MVESVVEARMNQISRRSGFLSRPTTFGKVMDNKTAETLIIGGEPEPN